MKIIESFIKGKCNNQSLCEDRLVITDDFIAVIDGVTAKSNRTWDGKAGGIAAAEAVCKAIQSFPQSITAESAVSLLTDAVASLYSENEEKGSAAAGVIIYSFYHNEIWSIGDCQCIINGEKHLHEKKIDVILSQKRANFIKTAIENGASEEDFLKNDTGRELILPEIKEQHKFANVVCELGYGVINGTSVPLEFIIKYHINVGDEIVLASDGYPILCDTLQESEYLLEKELSENPLCYKNYKSTKGIKEGNNSFDDRTYIKFQA
jgi:glycerophosphoryl diester phosphodiesterase